MMLYVNSPAENDFVAVAWLYKLYKDGNLPDHLLERTLVRPADDTPEDSKHNLVLRMDCTSFE